MPYCTASPVSIKKRLGTVDAETDHYDIQLLPTKLALFAFEIAADSLHLLRWDTLIAHSSIELVHHSLANIDANNLIDIRR